jgi:hypothetical protein
MPSIPDQCFDLIIDKALLDAQLCTPHNIDNASALVQEMYRVLAPGESLLLLMLCYVVMCSLLPILLSCDNIPIYLLICLFIYPVLSRTVTVPFFTLLFFSSLFHSILPNSLFVLPCYVVLQHNHLPYFPSLLYCTILLEAFISSHIRLTLSLSLSLSAALSSFLLFSLIRRCIYRNITRWP